MEGISQITGRHNSRLAHFRKVRDGKINELIFIEGLRLAVEALRSGIKLVECAVRPEWLKTTEGETLVGELIDRMIPVYEVPGPLFASISDTANSQGLILIGEKPETGEKSIIIPRFQGRRPLIICLQRTNDPSNVGAVCRTAEAAGADGLIISNGSADVYSPKSIRAAMGSNLRLPTWDNADLAASIAWAKEKGLNVRGADIAGSKSHFEVDWTVPSLVVFGSEAQGLSSDELDIIDECFRIPMRNDVESLNLAVSAGIVLFEAERQIMSSKTLTNGG